MTVKRVVVDSHRNRASFSADCLTCSWQDPRISATGKEANAVMTAARRHALMNPGHEVHLVSEATRVYKSAVIDA